MASEEEFDWPTSLRKAENPSLYEEMAVVTETHFKWVTDMAAFLGARVTCRKDRQRTVSCFGHAEMDPEGCPREMKRRSVLIFATPKDTLTVCRACWRGSWRQDNDRGGEGVWWT